MRAAFGVSYCRNTDRTKRISSEVGNSGEYGVVTTAPTVRPHKGRLLNSQCRLHCKTSKESKLGTLSAERDGVERRLLVG